MKLILFTSYSTGKPVAINPERVAAVQNSQATEGAFTVIKISDTLVYHVKEDFDSVFRRISS